jgi:cytoskeletal protein CcmA (bactofilin family)
MAANPSVIGRTTRIQGRITGSADLEVQGLVEGEIVVAGDVTVDQHGMVGAGVQARRLVVRGAIKGDLVGEEAVLLEDGARVVGDLRAPRIAIAPGALVRGFVQTGEAGPPPRATGKVAPAARPIPAVANKAVPKAAPVATAPKPAEKPVPPAAAPAHSASPAPSPRRPPPPVVPVLKKARGQIAKRKER